MTYAVYAGGMHVVEAVFDLDFSEKGRYDVKMASHTRGFLGSLVPWSGTFESNGWVRADKEKNKDFRPQLHKSTAIWRGEEEIKEYKYKKDGSFEGLFVTDHDKPTFKKDVEKELTDNSTDVLSATLTAMELAAMGKGCASKSEVFDGKRRFEMVFTQKRKKTLEASRYNVYSGEADECVVEVVPVAGAWHKKPRGWLSIQEQGREKGTMPTVWFGQLSEGLPAVPVKIMVKTGYGALVMHLVNYDDGLQKIALED